MLGFHVVCYGHFDRDLHGRDVYRADQLPIVSTSIGTTKGATSESIDMRPGTPMLCISGLKVIDSTASKCRTAEIP